MNCFLCEFPIKDGPDQPYLRDGPKTVHIECLLLRICGTAGHQLKVCEQGQNCGDPTDISAHESAKRAALVWAMQLNEIPTMPPPSRPHCSTKGAQSHKHREITYLSRRRSIR